MSAFLGKIHYLLYRKIALQENLYEELIQLAKAQGIEMNSVIDEANERFGKPIKGALEDIVDHGNIHGSLQSMITSVEARQGLMTLYALEQGLTLDQIKELYKERAMAFGSQVNIKEATPYRLYQSLYSLLLDGMPCDRVNQVLEEGPDYIIWQTQTCLHKAYWAEQEGVYYSLMDTFVEGFLEGAGGACRFDRDGFTKKIVRSI